ncbi:hypothetical protein L195_g018680 [Trifolium pratense]|uniref:Uncharacterized protein n=1 Tax=Trifolium pratense TaxID=57577 RepID=A0A2K3MKP7_TRIPR|nr:hypothetical protein L195_g030856 [Trifolium pratense]PNX91345.1 hypothetical protein L195_g047475 [Trifolium pratense]PNX91346.1 hypothetical protein L195_g047476 [Trifolium pratense]PNX95487.1 hypothetical protein L195_g018680 [Trifolium pratense]
MKKQGSLIFTDRHEENLFELSNEFWGVENGAVDGENGAEDGENGAEDGETGADDGENGADNMRMNVLKRAELDRRCVQLKVQEEKLRLQPALLLEEHVDLIYKSLLASSEVGKESKEEA